MSLASIDKYKYKYLFLLNIIFSDKIVTDFMNILYEPKMQLQQLRQTLLVTLNFLTFLFPV